jgi:hypothetical protein
MDSDKITGTETGREIGSTDPTTQHQRRARIHNTPSGSPEPMTPAGYIGLELKRARTALARTRIFGLILLLCVGGELTYITAHFTQSLRPHTAAEIADGYIMQQVNAQGPQVVEELKQKVPDLIAQTPDYALQQFPSYREALENRVDAEMRRYCQTTSKQLGQQLDAFLEDHKSQINGLLTAPNDPATMQQVGPALKQELMNYIQQAPVGSESIKAQLDQSLAALQDIHKTMHRLAEAKNLTPEEQKTRQAIGVIAGTIDKTKNQVKPALSL